jgi:fumarylpyruvate hydrolase
MGKNYAAHAAELGDAQPEQPVIFLKPPSAVRWLTKDSNTDEVLSLPEGEVHHELEVVFRLTGHPTAPFSAFTLGLDLTRRDLQNNLKKCGHPWEIAKVFKGSAVVGSWCSIEKWPQFSEQEFSLHINGQLKQKGVAAKMLWSPERCVQLVSKYFPVLADDILFTGTPVGVGPLKAGDRLEIGWGEKFQVHRLQIQP